MAQDYAIGFYNSTAWIKCRTGYMQGQNYICEKCKGVATICHHIIEITEDNINDVNITLSWDNLMAVCLDCHNKIHGNNEITQEGLRFDDKGNLVKI
jgi:5-methylcytosine-specific restriction endonuclease McrA